MKRREIKELATKTPKELWNMLSALRIEISKLTLDLSQNKVGNVSQMSLKKDDVARILTILNGRRTK